MESYSALLERLRAPQPSFQRFAVISVFEKLRSSPSHLSADSDPGREAIAQCLLSSSSPVVDQSVHELCRLVVESKMDLSRGFLELQSALEGCNSRLVPLFVKAIGLLVRFGFEKNPNFRFDSTETHPLVQVLLCRSEVRSEVQSELVQQVVLFIVESKRFGMAEVCDFLKPFLNFSVLRLPFSDSQSYSFVKDLISSMLSLCCSFPLDAMPLFKLLVQCLRYFPRKNDEDYRNFVYLGEYMVNSYIVILTQMVANGSMLIEEAQRCSVGLLETFLSPSLDICRHSGVSEAAVELSKCLLVAQQELHLPYMDETLSVALCLFFLLIQSELEHEQLSILKFLLFLLKWKSANENIVRYGFQLSEEVLLILPVISLVSSPSISVKGVATDILFMLEKCFQNMLMTPKAELVPRQEFPELGRLESVIFNLLQHLWFQGQLSKSSYFFSTFASAGRTDDKEIYQCPKAWVPQLKEYTLWIVGRRKSSQPISRSQEVFSTEMPLLLGSIAGALVMHPCMGKHAADSLAAIGVMEPKMGPTLLLAILFYNNSFSNKDNKHPDMSLKCLAMLPSLASHSAMIPLVVQTILPMLHKDAKPVLYATATRLLCKTWEINDRAFGSLQGILHPKWFTKFMSERNICVSIAASIRDVCRNNPDRGVDLILSVSACIESHDAIIQALGFQSLAHLCDADVIDFYTAWDVIAKNVVGYSVDPLVASSVCLLLRWGAMDAEAYSEALRNVLHILGQIGASEHHKQAPLWAKARASAFEALSHFEVFHVENCIPDLKSKSMELIVTETNPEVLEAVEGFVVKMMMHEHINRRRLVKEKRVTGNKIEKLLGVLPRVVFSTGRNQSARELPGAALLCLSFTPKDVNNQGASKAFQTVHSSYESALLEVAASLQLSRNILVALLSLQSWKPFMQRWMKAILLYLDTEVSPAALDKTLKAANDILKSLRRIAEESVPSSAENIAFAIGALCAVLPPSAHAVKASASKLLLSWLFQYEHEYRQWSAAISLGLISSCLHVTDHKQKFENINGLVEVLCGSKSTFVRGACGVGLGFCCQDLLTRAGAAEDSKLDLESYKMQELELLGKIVRTLSLMICRLTQCSPDFLQSIAACFPMCTHDLDTESSCKSWEDLEDDIWGISGLVLGLGNSIGAIYRAGMPDAVIKVKSLIISWFLRMNHSVQRTGSESNERVLSVGSSLVLPTVVACCRRVELMDDDELDHLLNGYKELISELVSVKKSGIFHQSLLMSSNAGAGNLLACILNEGVHSLKVEDVKSLVDLFRKGYSSPHPPSIHLGGMLGVVNALGAGAGTLVHMHYQSASLHPSHEQMESSYVIGPLLSSPACEPHLTSMMQEIFLVAQYSEDRQLQQHAAWAVSFLRHRLRSKDIPNFGSGSKTDAAASQPVSQSHSDDSTVMKLSLWLMNHSATGDFPNIDTATTVLRCLSRAPRLPTMDWGTIIRRCMRYGSQSAELLVHKKGTLREECVRFSSAHANRFDALLSFLDELSDLPRFRLLELTLQSCLLVHLGVLNKVFSGSRLEKLLNDTASYFSSLLSNCRGYSLNQKSLLRVSCWKGLYQCLDEAPLDSIDYMSHIKKCIEVLFFSLPDVHSAAELGVDQVNSAEEWSNAVRCLGKAPQDLLSDLLQVDLAQGDGQIVEVAKKIQAKARLVRIGSIPLTDLRRLKSYILNIDSHVIWDVLVEVVAVLQPEKGSIKRQWLADAVEICCVTHFPSTALLFLGLLSGSFCKYMPLLILDQPSVLSNLPVTLTSLLSEPSWEVIAESVVSHLWASTRRIYSWATHSDFGDNLSDVQTIDESENGAAFFLLRVLHHTCFLLRDYLPLEKQLWLANVVIP